jgi:hypothetical protein
MGLGRCHLFRSRRPRFEAVISSASRRYDSRSSTMVRRNRFTTHILSTNAGYSPDPSTELKCLPDSEKSFPSWLHPFVELVSNLTLYFPGDQNESHSLFYPVTNRTVKIAILPDVTPYNLVDAH